jgi:hypothetical protein
LAAFLWRLYAVGGGNQTFDLFGGELIASDPGGRGAFLWGDRRADRYAACMPVTIAGYMFGVGRHRAKRAGTKDGEKSCWHCAAISHSR